MRLFVAVDPPAEIRTHLAAALAPIRDRPGAPRWGSLDRWHVTVAFLGEVEAGYVDPLAGVLDSIGARTPPLTLWLGGAGTFPDGTRPRVLWTGLRGDVGGLGELSRAVRAGAGELGLPLLRQVFRGHLTLGRWRDGEPGDRGLIEPLADYESPAWVSAELRLVHSTLGAQPTYRTLHTARLEG